MTKTLDPTWNLDVVFDGGSRSEEFQKFLSTLHKDIDGFFQKMESAKAPESIEEAGNWITVLNTYEDVGKRLSEAGAFIECLRAQDMNDRKADELGNTVQSLYAQFKSCETLLKAQVGDIPESVWALVLKMDEVKDIQFSLEEMRRHAKEQLPSEQEQLINELSVDGYHGWSSLYDTVVGQMTIAFDHPKKGSQQLSVGQLFNLLTDNDRDVRVKAFEVWEKAWESQSEFCAAALNHLAGFRLKVYKQRQWDDVLREPLDINRMSRKTLDTMWGTIESNKPKVVEYLRRKAKMFGLEKLAWHDVEAPLSTEDKKVPYDEGAAFIVEQFSKFNPEMGRFAERALENRWVEAEDRPGKRPGGFCTSFPLTKESRIFMTYSGTSDNVSTLAHELGHAYHQSVMNDIPYLNQDYAMNVAETASTFAELILSDAAIKAAKSKVEQLSHLEDKLQRAVAFFMNIHARFLFETRFYEERKKGLVSVDRLNELMLEAQKEAYCDELASYHPAFWESKLHFYITDVPFYNFPYTFGYMFSTGIYAKALEEGPTFAKKYDALLRDTGSMRVEELAKKHLNADLEKPDFWKAACEQISKDVDLYLELTK
ncbi:MAG: M3 family oligoendopeptidase [Tuberibacillus sp.]